MKTNILIIGSGGREHALATKLSFSPECGQIFTAPGNGGTPNNVALDPKDFASVERFIRERNIGLTLVGPEDPLAAGIVDYVRGHGHAIFGPTAEQAQIEADKVWARNMQRKAGTDTTLVVFVGRGDVADGIRGLDKFPGPWIIKERGLCAGKGVAVAFDKETAKAELAERLQRSDVILEEYHPEHSALQFAEFSVFCFVDQLGNVLDLEAAQDAKPEFDGGLGRNTGGMGAFSPVPWLTSEIMAQVRQMIQQLVHYLYEVGVGFSGLLYAGLKMTPRGPKIIEYNCRFGDPETQVVLPRIATDILPIMLAVARGESIAATTIEYLPLSSLCVVAASPGYPGECREHYGKEIMGIDDAAMLANVIHAGTKLVNGKLTVNGGRVLNVQQVADVAHGLDKLGWKMTEAAEALFLEDGNQFHFRTDIGRNVPLSLR